MALPEYRDEVLISLSSVNPPPNFAFTERRIFMSKKKTHIEIGRTSKRNAAFEADKCNAWFDSPVMSRKHALLTFDSEKQKVFIKDTGSLHGTYKNDILLHSDMISEVLNGDRLKFGATIERGMQKYPPCTIRTSIKFGSRDPDDRGNCFRVPDESDIEDEQSSDDQVGNSCEMLRSNRVHPATSSFMIDLTREDRCPAPNLRNDTTLTTYSGEEITQLPSMSFPQALEPLPVPIGEYVSTSPKCQFSDIEEDEDDIDMVEEDDADVSQQVSITDTRSPFDQLSEVQSEISVSSPIVDAYDDTDAADEDEDFSEQDEFEDGPDHTLDISFYSSNDRPIKEASVETPVVSETTANQFSTAPPVACSEREDFEADLGARAITTSQQPDDVRNTHLHKIQIENTDYLWNRDLAPVASNKMPSSMKLPSLAEAIPLNQYAPSQTTAEIMGAKTGKHEYFNARESNKANVLVHPILSQLQPQSAEMVSRPPFWVDENYKAMPERAENTKEAHDDGVHQLAASELATCGTKFLDTPLQRSSEVPGVASVVPALDDSSAFKFQESKKALGIIGTVANAAHETVVIQDNVTDAANAVRSSGDIEQEPTTSKGGKVEANEDTDMLLETSQSSKRKAADISVIAPEERRVSTRERLLRRRPAFRVGKAKAVRSLYHSTSAVVAPPPHKRLRRMAEVVGYAALGGVAVMSALIATAPSL
ncbi:sarcolemmal membrane-associated [Fusarium heterosporum]|uniref:Sarcolemmal membrane-associated n=1 Tax=Fusarium heterosporum TaxID=42747 RepID=A0A8H5WNY6_FUSHE|nr:sarcolemmal membrane-associated [Fusarium heterosporum]